MRLSDTTFQEVYNQLKAKGNFCIRIKEDSIHSNPVYSETIPNLFSFLEYSKEFISNKVKEGIDPRKNILCRLAKYKLVSILNKWERYDKFDVIE